MSKLREWASKFKKEDKELMEKLKDVEFERKDIAALIIAALITIMPVVLLILGIFYLIVWIIFLR